MRGIPWAGHIPKVRPLFCRVPEQILARSPEDTLLIHQCRFAVRIPPYLSNEVFLGTLGRANLPCGISPDSQTSPDLVEGVFRISLEDQSPTNQGTGIVRTSLRYHDASLRDEYSGSDGISTVLSIASRLWTTHLGPANPGLTIIAQETLDFRRAGFSPAYKLLIPTFSLLITPRPLARAASLQSECSSTRRPAEAGRIRVFGTKLSPYTLSALLSHPSPRLRVARPLLAFICFVTLFYCNNSEGCPTKL